MQAKLWKRGLCALLALLLCFGGSVSVLGYTRNKKYTPVILIPGFSASPLYVNYGKENQKQYWGLDMDAVLAAVLDNLGEIGLGLGAMTLGKVDRLAKVVGTQAKKLIDPLRINPDGSSAYPLEPGYTKAAESNNQWLTDNRDGAFISEPDIMGGVAEIIGKANVFNFYCDFRRGAVECAKALRVFVEDVKAYTGSEKVSLCAISHGGQVAGAYLSLYGTKGDLDRVLLSVPALGGAAFAYDGLMFNVKLDEDLLVYYLECGFVSETSFEWLVQCMDLGFLDPLLNQLLKDYFAPVMLYWGSIWDFIPTQYYDALKEKMLDPVQQAWLIEKSDYMHHTVMAGYGDAFRAAQKAGAKVSIMSSTGAAAVTGSQVNSDAILPAAGSSGARVAPYGQRFSDGYTGTGKACSNPEHYHVSPSMEIDATHAYLPEHTWFVEGQFHGMSFWDPYTKVLFKKLLLTDEIEDIYTDPQYPQFGRTHNPKDALYIEFDKSPQGYVTAQDTRLRIYNLSEKYPAKVTSIECEGMELTFLPWKLRSIAPGGMAEIAFHGSVPDAHIRRAAITVHVLQLGAPSAVASRTFDYTILGGKPAAYNSEQPYAPVDFTREFYTPIGYLMDWFFSFLGLRNLLPSVWMPIVMEKS